MIFQILVQNQKYKGSHSRATISHEPKGQSIDMNISPRSGFAAVFVLAIAGALGSAQSDGSSENIYCARL